MFLNMTDTHLLCVSGAPRAIWYDSSSSWVLRRSSTILGETRHVLGLASHLDATRMSGLERVDSDATRGTFCQDSFQDQLHSSSWLHIHMVSERLSKLARLVISKSKKIPSKSISEGDLCPLSSCESLVSSVIFKLLSSNKRTTDKEPPKETFLLQNAVVGGSFRSRAYWMKVDFPTSGGPTTAICTCGIVSSSCVTCAP